jgi:hypothetical protein
MYTVKSQIDSYELGEGWDDNLKTARALAKYTESIWRADSSGFKDDIKIGFVIKQKEYGYDIEMLINTNNLDIIDEITSSLTDETTIWDRFCNDAGTTELWEKEA